MRYDLWQRSEKLKMQKDNPACYKCPKGKNGLHTWEGKYWLNILTGAICRQCGLKLTKEQAEDVWRE